MFAVGITGNEQNMKDHETKTCAKLHVKSCTEI